MRVTYKVTNDPVINFARHVKLGHLLEQRTASKALLKSSAITIT